MGWSWLRPRARRSSTAWHDEVNIASPAFKASPFPFYARLRAESPVCRQRLPTGEYAWLVTRYDDAVAALKDERLVKDRRNGLTPQQAAREPWFRRAFDVLKHNMLDRDPPDHTRLRALVQRAFTPRLVEQARPRIEALTAELLDAALKRVVSGGGLRGLDIIRDYALPLPTTIIAEMLGVPAADRGYFNRWSNALLAAAASSWRMLYAVPNALLMIRYIRGIIRRRRQQPQNDLISDLIRAEETGDKLNDNELLAMVFLLLVAGHETTVNLIASGVLALLEHPEQCERLRSEPALMKPAIEELLRYTSPAEMATLRYAREDVAIGGATIPQGDMIFPVILSANRDERQFPDPDALDITREPNRHLSFGLGTHFCLGASLARLEGQIAIGTLLARVPHLRLAHPPSRLRWRRGMIVRGLESLPVELSPP